MAIDFVEDTFIDFVFLGLLRRDGSKGSAGGTPERNCRGGLGTAGTGRRARTARTVDLLSETVALRDPDRQFSE